MSKLIFLNRLMLALLLFYAAGCALSPQTVPVNPELTTSAATAAKLEKILVQVVDNRDSPLMGYRGGVYETAAISTAAGITDSIQSELTRTMAAAGYVPVNSNQADLTLVVGIDRLAYSASQDKLIWNIEINATFSASVSRGSVSKTVQIQDRVTREFAKAPSEQENNRVVNNVINKVLQRIVDNNSLFNL